MHHDLYTVCMDSGFRLPKSDLKQTSYTYEYFYAFMLMLIPHVFDIFHVTVM